MSLPKPAWKPSQVVLTRIVVLVEHGHLGVGMVGHDVLGVDRRLGGVVGLPAHGPRELLGHAPLRRAGGDEELRHLLLVQVLLHHRVGRRAEQLVDREDLVVLDQLAHHLDGLGRLEAVVVGDEVDLAAVDAALVVDHVPVGGDALADHAVGRQRSRVGIGVAELDLLVADARIVLLLRPHDGRRASANADADATSVRRLIFVMCFLLDRPVARSRAGSVAASRAPRAT